MIRQWCSCQMKCKEDTEDTWTCCAHLADGRAFECRRSPLEVKTDLEGNYTLDKCPDFSPPGYDVNDGRFKRIVFIPSRSKDGSLTLKLQKE